MITFDVIASSSEGCSYLVSGGGASRPLLIDAGVNIPTLRKKLPCLITELAGSVISHSHQDHCRAAKALTMLGVNIYASEHTLSVIDCCRPYRAVELIEGKTQFVDTWQVRPFEAVHDCEGTFGFIVCSPDQQSSLLYLTDSCYTKYRFKNLTHIAVECNHSEEIIRENTLEGAINMSRFARTSKTHMSLERLIEMLKSNDLSKVQVIYLLHLSDTNSDEIKFKNEVEAATGIPTVIAKKR